MADDDARRWLSCFGWGCLAVVVVSALAIGGCVAFVYRGSAGATTVTDAYLAAVDEGRYQDAYAMLGPSFADRQELSDFVAFEQNARSHLGACSEWARRGTGFNRHDAYRNPASFPPDRVEIMRVETERTDDSDRTGDHRPVVGALGRRPEENAEVGSFRPVGDVTDIDLFDRSGVLDVQVDREVDLSAPRFAVGFTGQSLPDLPGKRGVVEASLQLKAADVHPDIPHVRRIVGWCPMLSR